MDEKLVLQTKTHALGFSLCGVTSANALEGFDRFERWLSSNRYAGMSYLATERSRQARADPRFLVPEAKAVIVVAAIYPSPTIVSAEGLDGGVASYALGEDYHEVISKRLWQICRQIDTLAGQPLRHRVYTDSGPLLERELAMRAGLGWIGKNSMLIHPKLGSHFFLGEIITEFPFLPDLPFTEDRCGACDRCIQACPTGCIHPDRTIDARRCLSYLTIEHRGTIPPALRPQMGKWIFGCDICQSVCPWNRKNIAAVENAFLSRSHFPLANIVSELVLDEDGYRDRFRRSPLRRTRRDGYRRNLIVANGNARARDSVPFLVEILFKDPAPILRGHAAWALGKIGTREAVDALITAVRQESDLSVALEIREAISNPTLDCEDE